MMYQSKMAIAVKANSRVLRELEDAVYIPFGSEYSLLIKNLNSVKALVRIWIDGTDVTDGTSLVVNPNSSIDLERFIKNGNMDAGNKFKFIERTAQISNHRGNTIDDGLIRVEFEFEKPRINSPFGASPMFSPTPLTNSPLRGVSGRGLLGDAVGSAGTWVNNIGDGSLSAAPIYKGVTASASASASSESIAYSAPVNEVGITVEGAISNQQFKEAAWFPTDGIKHVMVMRIFGEVEGKPVVEAVTVKTKATCPSCGQSNKANAKFCSGCGTGLQIV